MQQARAQAEESRGLFGASPGSLESRERAAWLAADPTSLRNSVSEPNLGPWGSGRGALPGDAA